MTDPELQAEAVRAVEAALALVQGHRLAEVEIIIASDRSGVIHVRTRVSGVPLPALVRTGLDKPV